MAIRTIIHGKGVFRNPRKGKSLVCGRSQSEGDAEADSLSNAGAMRRDILAMLQKQVWVVYQVSVLTDIVKSLSGRHFAEAVPG